MDPYDPDMINMVDDSRHEHASFYEKNMAQHLQDHDIYMHGRPNAPQPANIGVIRHQLRERRDSLENNGFTQAHFQTFRAAANATTGHTVVDAVIPVIAGNTLATGGGPMMETRMVFHNLDAITGLDRHALPVILAAPCGFDGVARADLDDDVQTALDALIAPLVPINNWIIPNFVLDGMGTADSTPLLEKQRATYHGALAARSMHAMHSYGRAAPHFDDCAYAFSATYLHLPKLLTIYAHHVTPTGAGGRPAYHMTRVGVYPVGRNRTEFLAGAAAFRNAREMAGRWRDEAVERANLLPAGAPVTVPALAPADGNAVPAPAQAGN
ncbi:hypothetical protein IMZ48_01190 [Candidatus Bathyarchaeota archaeon]|nr:hypothetical protein [Candidatus Bathyarchaeota archaeon]